METLSNFVSDADAFLWGLPMIVLLFGTHLYLTVRLKFPQRKIFKAIKLSFQKESGATGDISSLSALMTALAATIGTGNIIGVATSVSLGGPGAVFWCWLTGVFGIATKYSECLLSVKYRVRTTNGNVVGGPMYVLRNGLNMKFLAVLFCLFTIIASFGIGNMVQVNSIALLANMSFGISYSFTGVVLMVLVALVVIFGIKGISKACMLLVPLMAAFYVGGCLLILIINYRYLDDSIVLILKSAFSSQAVGGGFVGSSVMMAARYGIARSLFSNESGMGSAPIVAAAAKTRNPVRQALISSTGTFWDTVVICALSGLVIVSSVIAYPDIDPSKGAELMHAAFGKLPYVGSFILTVGLFSFTFSTILGWFYYGEKSIEYLAGRSWIYVYRIVGIGVIYVGAVFNLGLVWNISDCMNAMMAIPNLISLLLLSGVVAAETNKHLWSDNLDGE